MEINKKLIFDLLDQVSVSSLLYQNYNLRTSKDDGSQRMLNAFMLGNYGCIVPAGAWHTVDVFLLSSMK